VLLADRLTYVHEPKTGGTFVNHVLGRLHGGLTDIPASRLRGPALRVGFAAASYYPELLRARWWKPRPGESRYGRIYRWNDHGTCSEIPAGRRSKPILATVRNPLETYVSLFHFGWWKRPEYLPVYRRFLPEFDSRYPNFPDVSFREFLELLHAGCVLPASRDLDDRAGVGYLTERFVRFYFRLRRALRGYDPGPVLRKIDDSYLDSGRFRADMFEVTFIHTSRLNRELRDFLAGIGYEDADLEFVESLEHVVPAGGSSVVFAQGSASEGWPRYYTPDLEETVRARDRLIFTLFPELALPAITHDPTSVTAR
jgi:hypothetical protein